MAQLHLDSLAKKRTTRQIVVALDNLPTVLEKAYDEAMERIWSQDSDDVELAERVLGWISCAKRPLTVEELQHALAITPESTDIDEEDFMDEEIITSVCAGLVTVDNEGDIIRLVHYTTQEYLEVIRNTRLPNAEYNIAMACLNYFELYVFDEPCIDERSLKKRLAKYEFGLYAAEYWADHVRGAGESKMINTVCRVFQSQSTRESTSQIESYADLGILVSPALHRRPLLHFIAANGLAMICQVLLDGALNDNDLFVLTLLRVNRTESGQEVRVQVNVEEKDDKGRTALIGAARNGHTEVVKLLLNAGANMEAKDTNGWTSLIRVAWNGHTEMVKLLLNAGANMEAKDRNGWISLICAAYNGHTEVVKLLLNAGANLEAKDTKGWTSLICAAWNGHIEVIKLLLKAGANLEAKDEDGWTSLIRAAWNGHTEVVKWLLNAGANLEAKDEDGWTSLIGAARNGHTEVVKLLLKAGANLEAEDEGGSTSLCWAESYRHTEVVKLLFDAKVGVSTECKSR
jgi:ankyrin repeat protein